MKESNGISTAVCRIIVAVTLLLGCCGFGRSMSSINFTNHLSDTHEIVLSCNDSILQEIGYIVRPNTKLNKQERKRITNRIKELPHRIVRRDTTRYFLQTAFAIAYYEFDRKDYRKALSYVEEFNEKAMPHEFWKAWLRYSSVGFNASSSIREKGKIHGKDDSNSWWTPIKYDFEISFQRNEMHFLDNLFDDIPLDGDLSVYLDLLRSYRDMGGKLVWLNSYNTNPGFFQKCRNLGRDDILSGIYELWGVTPDGFQYNRQNRQIAFVDTTLKPDTAFIANFNNLTKNKINTHILDSLDPEWNRNQVDSLISIGKPDSISQPLYSLLNITYNRHNFREVINICEKYEQYCPANTRLSLYNHWGLSEAFTGRFDSAIAHYDEALKYSTTQALTLVLLNNKACALGEAGKYREAIDLFNSIEELQTTPFDRFCWNDNLGYVYSYIDPATALVYYNNAEHYLDNSVLYSERKVRHFCRKARILTHNPFLRRQAIESALQYTRIDMPDTISIGVANTELAAYYNSIKDYEKADECLKLAERCFAKLVPEDRRVSNIQLPKAENLRHLGRFDEAYSILSNLYCMQTSPLDNHHIELLPTLRELCSTLFAMGASEKVITPHYNTYVGLRDNILQYNIKYEDIMLDIEYAMLYGDSEKAINIAVAALDTDIAPFDKVKLIEYLEQAYRNSDDYNERLSGIIPKVKHCIIQSLLAVDSQDASTVSNPLSSILDGSISQLKNYDTECENALELSLFRKGLLFSTRNAVEKAIRSNRCLRPKFRKLQEMRKELNFAVSFSDEYRITNLIPAISSLERELNNAALSNKGIYTSIDRTLPQVIQHLSSSDVAIDFVHYRNGEKSCYGAFVIKRNEQPTFIKLFNEGETKIDGMTVWSKLLPFLSTEGNVYFSPDGALSSIGIEFLSPDCGDIMCKRYNLHRVFHLCDIKGATKAGKHYSIIGISDHNSPVGEGETIDRGAWTDLPNVKYELNVIERQLEGLSPTIYFNDDAREDIFKRLKKNNISVLHLSTHGFFRDNDSLRYASEHPEHFDYHIAKRALRANKTELSGLVLRGGNISWRTPEILDDEDDLLTSDEIEAMDFPDLNLVVLSACETGLGQTDSEGVWGLQRAFRIAGCKSLICTLNKVDDYWTAQFMEELYKNAANGMTIYDSFHSAHKTLWETPECPRELLTSFILIE